MCKKRKRGFGGSGANSIKPQSHKKVGDYVIQVARDLGFADPTWVDIDSPVQEANIAYPLDATLMQKLAIKAERVLTFTKSTLKSLVPSGLGIDMSNIKKLAREYFFLSKNTNIEKKCLQGLLRASKRPGFTDNQLLGKTRPRGLLFS